jgi:deoxyribodipyrimidine photolyase-like uncharacterized protein
MTTWDAKIQSNNNIQILTDFPNQNKHIDYVIVSEKSKNHNEINAHSMKQAIVRKAFFDDLKENGFQVYEIENESEVFTLLNASVERLLEEAEITRLEMTLKNVIYFTVLCPFLNGYRGHRVTKRDRPVTIALPSSNRPVTVALSKRDKNLFSVCDLVILSR